MTGASSPPCARLALALLRLCAASHLARSRRPPSWPAPSQHGRTGRMGDLGAHGATLATRKESVGLLDDKACDAVTEQGIWVAKPTMQSWRRRVGTTLIPRGAAMSVTHGVAKSISAALAAELGEQRRHLAPPRCGAHGGRAWWWESSGLGGSADARTRGPQDTRRRAGTNRRRARATGAPSLRTAVERGRPSGAAASSARGGARGGPPHHSPPLARGEAVLLASDGGTGQDDAVAAPGT
jgi:hypothetical protein